MSFMVSVTGLRFMELVRSFLRSLSSPWLQNRIRIRFRAGLAILCVARIAVVAFRLRLFQRLARGGFSLHSPVVIDGGVILHVSNPRF